MKRLATFAIVVGLSILIPIGSGSAQILPVVPQPAPTFIVIPFEFDPHGTFLVASLWKSGIGCPTDAKVVPFVPPDFTEVGDPVSYTDPACVTGDSSDHSNQGLLLAKTGPTNNDASGGANLDGVAGTRLFELGYDLRKAGATIASPFGSHCGAGAPRFNVYSGDAIYFVGCASPPPTLTEPGIGWMRLTWGGGAPLMAFDQRSMLVDITGIVVDCIEIIFDEGQDPNGGPDMFGLAVLDNINVNGARVGREP
jgi:hypothetical protein